MLRRGKEEDRIEKIIRGLLKLPDNRRCINCNSLGPQYVCTTFWTFVCTSCSGVHREFTHRVKSVSMAKFSPEEVSCLQAAGNERAKQIYFKAWDPQRNSYPESGNLHRLREFIKHVYVDRKYSGGRDSDKLTMAKVDPKADRCSIEKSCQWGKQDDIERRTFEKSLASGKIELRNFIEERRGPKIKEKDKPNNARPSKSTARFEIVDDRFKDDTYGSSRRSKLASGSLSSDSQNRKETREIPQGARPLQEILGSSFPPLKVPDTSKANDRRDSNSASKAKKTEPSGTQGSAEGKVVEQKTVSLSSLIDFSEPDSPQPQNQLAITNIDTGNASSQTQTPPSNMNSVDSLFFELSSPVATKSEDSTTSGNKNVDNGLALVPTSSGNDVVNKANEQLTLNVLPHQSVQPHQQSWPSRVPNDQSQTPYSSAPHEQLSQSVHRPAQETSSENVSQMAGRKELPEDIFASSYSAYQAPVPNNWQYRPTNGMGYGIQYQHTAVITYPNTTRSTNPFDIADDGPSQAQSHSFSSILPTQGALPQVSTPSQPPFQPSSFVMNIPPGTYMGQQHPNNMLIPRPQGNNNTAFASFYHVQQPSNPQGNNNFGSLNPFQMSSGRSEVPGASPNTYSSRGGNPFG